MKRILSILLCACLMLSLCVFASADDAFSNQWTYEADEAGGIGHYDLKAVYCDDPVDPELQYMVIHAPAAYLKKNADGSVSVNPEGMVVSSTGAVYTAETAPILLHNTSGGYTSSKINVDESYIRGYLGEGYVAVEIQTRGKESQDADGKYIGQFPLIMADLKAGVRFLKANDAVLPGNSDRIVSRGFSSGGAVSAMLGASGNSPVFDSYLAAIGAADATDDIFITLASAPITNLSSADASYEWYQHANPEYFLFNAMAFDREGNPLEDFPVGPQNMYPLGSNVLGGAHEDELSDLLYGWYVDYVQGLGFDLGDDGRSGGFYEGFARIYADALEEFIARYDEVKGVLNTGRSTAPDTAEEYLARLGQGWFSYDAATGEVTMTDLDSIVANHIQRKKMCPSLDSYNYKSNENDAFKDADGKTVHFSGTVRDALKTLLEDPAYTWTDEERAYIEALFGDYDAGISADSTYMLEVMSPINYIVEKEGFEGASVSPYWRLRVGSEDGDHGAPAAWLIAEGLKKYQPQAEVSVGIAWGMGHSLSELTEQDLYDYIAAIMVKEDGLPMADVQTSSQTLRFGGASVSAQAYNIAGSNYFKLRDVAQLLNGSGSQFSVDYDAAARAVRVATGEAYAPIGGELETGPDRSDTWAASSQSLYVDGERSDLAAFNIGGANYFKLRDLADALGFTVEWNGDDKTYTVSAAEASAGSGGSGGGSASGSWGGSASGGWGGGEASVEATEVVDGFYILNESRTRAFLAVGSDRALLIDTMYENDKVLDEVRKLTDLPVDVVITHGHPDHIGGIGAFGACYIHEADAYFLDGKGVTLNYVKEGDELAYGDFAFEVIETPGHTKGSISLLDRAHKLLVTGDEVQAGPIMMFDEECDMAAYAESMRKLSPYAAYVEKVFAGHNALSYGPEYIGYCYADAVAYLNGDLAGTPVQSWDGATRVDYKGEHVTFRLAE